MGVGLASLGVDSLYSRRLQQSDTHFSNSPDFLPCTRDPTRSSRPSTGPLVGERVTVVGAAGHAPYVLMGRGNEWEPVALMKGFDGRVVVGARASDGTLWLVTSGDGDAYRDAPVLRRPTGGGWEPVSLPPLEPSLFDQGKGWVYRPNPFETKIGEWSDPRRRPTATTSPACGGTTERCG